MIHFFYLDHWHSEKLREHAQRIMAIVGQVVRALTRNDKAKIEKMLQVGDSDTLLYLKAILEYWREQDKRHFLLSGIGPTTLRFWCPCRYSTVDGPTLHRLNLSPGLVTKTFSALL